MRGKGKGIYVILFILLLPSSLLGTVITRSDVISNAKLYLNLTWSPLKDTCLGLTPTYTSYFKVGGTYTGEAYCWGGFDRYGGTEPAGSSSWPNKGLTFPQRISNKVCPGGYNTSQYGSLTATRHLAGIDCSGYVTRCRGIETNGFHPYNTTGLWNIGLDINYEDLKPGDILDNPGDHVVIYSDGKTTGSWNVYEAVGGGRPYRVTYREFPYNYLNYIPVSIFPQFSSPQPEPNSGGNGNEVDISVVVEGSGEIEHPYMEVDGAEVPCSFSNGKITAHVNLDEVSPWNTGSRHTVEVIADNYVSEAGNDYRDDIEWSFYEEVAPPIVISTDPSNGQQNVPVDINQISITFSRPMDTQSTQGAIYITDGDGNGVPNDSFAWEDSNRTMKVFIDTLDYCKTYNVIITDAATDTSGIKLDGNGDGEYNREIVIRDS